MSDNEMTDVEIDDLNSKLRKLSEAQNQTAAVQLYVE